MIDRKALLTDLQALLRKLEADLLERADSNEVPEVGRQLKSDYDAAREAERTAESYESWLSAYVTQAAAAWVLSCVFARFLEDNELVSPPKLSGPSDKLSRARDEHELYFREHPTDTDREYLLAVFNGLAQLPGAEDVFGRHNPLHELPNWLSGDAAGELLAFFQKIEADTGDLVHDFADPNWDTRFLGDLYQDLSEAARKKYALLQTPEFVEEFILDRTLEPAIDEFGLDAQEVVDGDRVISEPGFRMIDPACGSGHFLLGAFDRILNHWRKKDPSSNERIIVQRALDSVFGVDLNPYAIAIARFRLLLAALSEAGITQLKDAPDFKVHLAAGDSLLHGSRPATRGIQASFDPQDAAMHHYQAEDRDLLQAYLRHGIYHAVVGNPPYITPKDRQQNQNIRDRYGSCHRQYALSVPFMERLFDLAVERINGKQAAGLVGQITANSFMKREFGKKLIEEFIPRWDLTHVIDTSGAYIPGHGTPTVILFGRHGSPVVSTVRSVMGIRGEPSTPDEPARGLVWSAIIEQVDQPGSQSEFVSAGDTQRNRFTSHPWSIGGGGASELKEHLENNASSTLASRISEIGRTTHTGEDDVFYAPRCAAVTRNLSSEVVPLVIGEDVRDYNITPQLWSIFPYEQLRGEPINPTENLARHFWTYRRTLKDRQDFGQKIEERGLRWIDHSMFFPARYRTPLSIAFAFVATHNHFVLDRGGKVFKQSAPVIKLPPDATEDDHLALLGLLNSSVACFWMQQTMHNKGGPGGGSSKDEKWHDFYEFSGTRLTECPLPESFPLSTATRLDELVTLVENDRPHASLAGWNGEDDTLQLLLHDSKQSVATAMKKMIALQEELDWQCYDLFGMTDRGAKLTYEGQLPQIEVGERAFEIVLSRKIAAGTTQSKWFEWLGAKPITEIPSSWPDDYCEIVERRIELIEKDRDIGLIENVNCKRRWEIEPWESQLERALRNWMLDRLESYFDFDGRMSDGGRAMVTDNMTLLGDGRVADGAVSSVARLADVAGRDDNFREVAALYRDDPAFDVQSLVEELVRAESVPLLPVLRYKPAGLRKRKAWQETWTLQREEDDLARQREEALRAIQSAEESACQPIADQLNELKKLKKDLEIAESAFLDEHFGTQHREPTLSMDNDYLLNVRNQTPEGKQAAVRLGQLRDQHGKLDSELRPQRRDLIAQSDEVRLARDVLAEIPDDPEIPVPPKYKSSDFISTGGARYWALRGKLDVPKERWISFPHCEADDGTQVICWAGYDHLQQARAIAAYFVHVKEESGGQDDPRLVPLLACMIELLPWLKQWHNDIDPEFNLPMGDYYEGFIQEEARSLDMTIDEIKAWEPPRRTTRRRRRTAT